MSIVAILTFTRTNSRVELAAVLTPKQAAQILKLETRLETGLRITAALFALPIHHAARAVPVRPHPRAAVLVLVCCDGLNVHELSSLSIYILPPPAVVKYTFIAAVRDRTVEMPSSQNGENSNGPSK